MQKQSAKFVPNQLLNLQFYWNILPSTPTLQIDFLNSSILQISYNKTHRIYDSSTNLLAQDIFCRKNFSNKFNLNKIRIAYKSICQTYLMLLSLLLLIISFNFTKAKLLDTSVSCDQVNYFTDFS